MDDLIDWPAVLRYLAGESSPTEQRRIATWIDADPERRAYVESLRAIEAADTRGANEYDATAARSKVWTRLGLSRASSAAATRPNANRAGELDGQIDRRHLRNADRKSTEAPGAPPRPWPQGVGGDAGWVRKGRATTTMAIAATVVIALGVGLAVGSLRHPASDASPGHEYATVAGQRLAVMLMDGTRMTLAPASRVRVAADYGQGARRVELEGEAFFAVIHDVARPFTVHAANAVVTDVGTQFDVRSYADDHHVRVAVAEGQVVLAAAEGGTAHSALMAGDLGEFDASGAIAVAHSRDVGRLMAWRQGGLVFDDTPLREVVTDLDRAFDLDIAVADSALLARHITFSFGEESADEILDAISFSVGASYTRVGRRVTIHRQAGARRHNAPVSPASTVLTARETAARP